MESRRLFVSLFIATTFAQPIAAQSLSDGLYHTIQQKSSGRYGDAYGGQHDSAAVLRFVQFNDTQKWKFDPVPGQSDVYTIQQVSNSRYLDAYEQAAQDHGVVTRTSQDNDTQRWQLVALENDEYRLKLQSSNRFLDALDTSNNDFALVTPGSARRRHPDMGDQAGRVGRIFLHQTHLVAWVADFGQVVRLLIPKVTPHAA